MPFLLYANARATLEDTLRTSSFFEDDDAVWDEGLENDKLKALDDKTDSYAISGAEFRDPKGGRTLANCVWSHGLVLDVDVWRPDRPPFTADDLRERLAGNRFIAWTTYSSSVDMLRWRVVIPFARPMPPLKYRPLWRIINGLLDGTMAEATSDVTRLGFLGSVRSETDKQFYQYFINKGQPRVDWADFEIEDEVFSALARALKPADLSRGADWSTDAQALEYAKRYFRRVGTDVVEGSRHDCLMRASCKLWWDFAASDEKFVRTILTQINNNFAKQKTEDEVEAEVTAGYDRTMGPNRTEQPSLYGLEREPVRRATVSGLAQHAVGLRRARTNDQDRVIGTALGHIAAGEAFAEPIEARVVTHLVAEEVAKAYPREIPGRLLDLMRPAIEVQRAKSDTVPTDEEILGKMIWTQQAMRKRSEEREQNRKDTTKARILQAFGGKRDTPYTSKELREFEHDGLSDNHWILQKDRSYYFFVGGDYRGPFTKDSASNFAAVFLSPASEKIVTTFIDKNGVVRHRPIDDMVKDYGSVVEKVERSLTIERTKYIEDTATLVQAVGVPRRLEPKRSEEVETWLKKLMGKKYIAFCEWLAVLTMLDHPCAALFLCMPPSVGKSLLVSGIARLWTESGPSVLEGFTPEVLERCPLVFCDDYLPPAWKQFTAKLRSFVSEGSRPAKQMYADRYQLTGYARIVFASNNPSMITSSNETTRSSDLEAVQDRILMIESDDDDEEGVHPAREYLEQLGKARRNMFITDDEIAKHALWVRDNTQLSKERFFISDPGSDVKSAMLSNNENRSRIFEWVYAYLAAAKSNPVAVLSKDGQLYAHSIAMFERWNDHDQTRRGVKVKDVTLPLSAVSHKDRVLLCVDANVTKLSRVWYKRILMPQFEYWCKSVDADYSQVRELMQQLESKRQITIGPKYKG